MRIRKTRSLAIVAVTFCLVWATGATIVMKTHKNLESAHADQYSNPAYAAQPGRNHMVLYNQTANGMTDAEVNQTASNYTYVNINENDGGGSWSVKSNDASRILTKNSKAIVFNYYRASYFSSDVMTDMGAYSNGFKLGDVSSATVTDQATQGWLLREYVAPTSSSAGGNIGKPLMFDGTQYFLDITNPAYQAWLIPTIAGWVQASHAAGIKFDTTNFLIGNAPPNGGQYGKTTVNDLLCGPGTWDRDGSNCPKVTAWNNALAAQIRTAVAVMHPLGKQVFYNGISPSEKREDGRMLSILTDAGADGAMDETFCADVSKSLAVKYVSLKDDFAIMANPAYASKKLLFQTNYNDDSRLSLAPYCIGGFLMGWQPGQSYYKIGKSYSSATLTAQPDPSRNFYPHNGIDEIDLNLGNPTARYAATGSIYSRTFQNGFVAVNDSDSAGSVRLPAKMTQFSKGVAVKSYDAGATVSLAARSSIFFLNDSYLYVSSAAGSTGNTGSNTGKTKQGTTTTNQTNGQTSTAATGDNNDQVGSPSSKTNPASSSNSQTPQNSFGNVAKRTFLPAALIVAVLAIVVFVLYRRGLIRWRWLHHSPVEETSGASTAHTIVMTDEINPTASNPTPPTNKPGSVITPEDQQLK